MKKYIYLLIVFLCCESCSKELEISLIDQEQLILNGRLDAGTDENLIYVSLSTGKKIGHVNQAQAELYVNGQLAEHLQDVTNEQDFMDMPEDSVYLDYLGYGQWFYPDAQAELSRSRVLSCKAKLQAGDVVELKVTAEQGKLKASARVVIPDKPMLVDTSIKHDDRTQYLLKVKDSHVDKSYYRIEIRHRDLVKAHYLNYDHVKLKDSIFWMDCVPRLKTDRDLVFNETGVSSDISVPGIKPRIENQYAVFTNQLFQGKEREILIELNGSCNRSPSYKKDFYVMYNTLQYKGELRLYALSDLSYIYYRCLNLWESDDYDEAVMDPIIFPCNVNGGLGFIDACFSVNYKFEDKIIDNEY